MIDVETTNRGSFVSSAEWKVHARPLPLCNLQSARPAMAHPAIVAIPRPPVGALGPPLREPMTSLCIALGMWLIPGSLRQGFLAMVVECQIHLVWQNTPRIAAC